MMMCANEVRRVRLKRDTDTSYINVFSRAACETSVGSWL
ncbi:hypothetical protein DES53_105111 [Roseimicrobium gellanilyticum]|uniref:Uncharacterized protein n=1 Tax=Roseimicrobium gellanilyticum TaxID=748857 RepID=A0A366HN09_9BACT|nr:hypothetical protein DES53_105111 [Roseimicrobium gellanilyticum]